MTDPTTPAPATEARIQVGGRDVRYQEGGAGPALIHLPDGGAPTWSAAHDLLARHLRIVAIGASGPEPASTDSEAVPPWDLARLPDGVADGLGIERYSLWGTADGARAALWSAMLHPDRLDALVLESPPALWPDSDSGPRRGPVPLSTGEAEAPAEHQRVREAAMSSREARPGWDSLGDGNAVSLGVAEADAALARRLGDITVPTLALFGTQDASIPPAERRAYRRQIQTCHLVLVYAAGPRISTDRPEAFASVVADFVERRETFVVGRANHLIHP